MNQNTSAQKHPSAVVALLAMAFTLALVIWLRHDALDTYWQQTRHSELGLSTLSRNDLWVGGIDFTKALADALKMQEGKLAEMEGRMMLAANKILHGRRFFKHMHPVVAPTSMLSLAPPSPIARPLISEPSLPAAADSSNEFAPAEDGRIVLTAQDRVLLVGDSMMQGVAPHVARALQKANIHSVDLSRQSTGLAYPSYFDWPATVQKAIPKENITVMVVFLGANDTWDMILGGHKERFGSEKWRSVYASRIDSMVKFAQFQHVRVIWLGAPDMGREKLNSGVKILNQLFVASANGGTARYVSTREILGDNSETYQKHITRDDGKNVTVRTDDGVHFTRDGQKMLSDLIMRQFVIPSAKKSS